MNQNSLYIPRPKAQANSGNSSSSSSIDLQSIVNEDNKRLQQKIEDEYWAACVEQEAYNAYLKVYPDGAHAREATIGKGKGRTKRWQGGGNHVMLKIFFITIAIFVVLALIIKSQNTESSNDAPKQSHLVAPAPIDVTDKDAEEPITPDEDDEVVNEAAARLEALADGVEEDEDDDWMEESLREDEEEEDDIFHDDEDDDYNNDDDDEDFNKLDN